MKIALISTPFLTVPPVGYGGLERVVWDLAIGLIAEGEKVVVLAAEGSKTPPGGLTVEVIPCANQTNVNWQEMEKRMWQVYDPMLADFDIIHGHNWFGYEYASKANNLDYNVCHTHHGYLNTGWWSRTKPPFKLNLMAISEWMVENYGMLGFNAKRIYNGVDMEAYPYSDDHGERLLFVGRIAEFKQPHVAIKAALKAGYSIDVVGGTFVDNHRYVDKIVQMAEDPRVTVHLDVPHERKIELLQQARALLFPSAMGEPFGLVSVEAMACGTPVVALDDGAISEIITAKTGIICRASSEDDAVDLMAQAIKDLDVKSSDCRDRANEFSSTIMAKNYLEAYNEILNGNEW